MDIIFLKISKKLTQRSRGTEKKLRFYFGCAQHNSTPVKIIKDFADFADKKSV
jgi:hypothetical protein